MQALVSALLSEGSMCAHDCEVAVGISGFRMRAGLPDGHHH